MNATYFDVATLISDEGSFGSLGVDIFGGEWGDADRQILVLDGEGIPSDLPQTYEQPTVQVLVRGNKNESDHEVYLTAKLVSDFLLFQSDNVVVNDETYKGFQESSNIAPMGKDSKQRFAYSMNFFTWRNRIEEG